MWIFFYLAMVFLTCRGEISVEVVKVGQNVTLTCRRLSSSQWKGYLYWSRHSPNGVPEVLATLPFHGSPSTKIPHITANHPNSREFNLHVSRVHLKDTGYYFCSETHSLDMSYYTATFLLVKEQDPRNTAVLLNSSLHLDHSMNLHCSVFSGIHNKTCSEEKRVFWLKSGREESVPNVLMAQETTSECEQKSTNSCIFNFHIKSSATETFYCAVVSCGNILFSNGIKLNDNRSSCILSTGLLGSVLTLNLVVIALLTAFIIKQRHDLKNVLQQTQTQLHEDQEQVIEDVLVYAAPIYNKSKRGRKENPDMQDNVIYTGVRGRE